MSKYTATVIKIGNSVALRVPKQYAEAAELVVGENVRLVLLTKPAAGPRQRVKLA